MDLICLLIFIIYPRMTTSSTSTLARLPFKQPRQTTSKAEVVIDRPNEAEVTEVIMKGPYQISIIML